MFSKPIPMDAELRELIAKAKARFDAMPMADRIAEMEAQKASYVRAELAIGSDADEAEYRQRMEAGLTLHNTPSGAPPNERIERAT